MSSYTGRRFVDPLNKNIGRRTGKDVRAGKKIRVDKDGFENFDDFLSESDADVTREYSRHHKTIREESESADTQESDDECKENQPAYNDRVSQSMPNAGLSNSTCNNFQSSQILSQGDAPNRSKFGWLRNRNIGRRTGKNLTANKQIRVDENGFENFDDYFSDTDTSSLSSRLSVSVVKPDLRRSAVSNHLKGRESSSDSSQESHRSGSEDEVKTSELREEDRTSTQHELKEHTRNITNNSVSCHEENTYTVEEEENAVNIHSNRSLSDHDDQTVQSESVNQDSISENEGENTGEKRNNASQMSDCSRHTSSYVDTPLSSKRNRSRSSVVSNKYSNRKISPNSKLEITSGKHNSQKKSEFNGKENSISSEKHKMSTGRNKSELKNQTSQSEKTRASFSSTERANMTSEIVNEDNMGNYHNSEHDEDTEDKELDDSDESHEKSEFNSKENSNSSEKHRMSTGRNKSELKNQTSQSEKTRASFSSTEHANMTSEIVNEDNMVNEHNSENDEDTEDKELDDSDGSHENSNTTDNNQLSDEEMSEESEAGNDIDTESDKEVVQEGTQIEGELTKSRTKLSQDNEHEEKTNKINTDEEKIRTQSVSRNETEVQVIDNEDKDVSENESDGYEDPDDLRPSQMQTNIDVAGNRSGSITKLDIPASVVSFNRTRKRLSYSAGEASLESIEKTKSRIEKANAELFDTNNTQTSEEVKSKFQVLPSKTAEKNNTVSSKKLKDSQHFTEESSDFLCLASRSTFTQISQDAGNSDDEEDDDIMILDYEKQKVKSPVKTKKSDKNKNKKHKQKSDTESQSDGGKETKITNTKRGSKSEIKVRKVKGNNKSRRQTTHELKEVDVSNVKTKKQNKVLNDDLVESLDVNDYGAVSDVDINATNNGDTNDLIENESETNVNKGKGKESNENSLGVEENTTLKRNGKRKQRKSRKKIQNSRESNDSESKPLAATISENPVDTDSDEENVKLKKSSRKTNKNKNSAQNDTENIHSDEGNQSHKVKSKRKLSEASNDTDLNADGDEGDYETEDIDDNSAVSKNQKKKKSGKKQKRNLLPDNENIVKRNDRTLKRKSSSEDEIETKTKKAKKIKSDRKSKGQAKSSKGKNDGVSLSDNDVILHKDVNFSPELPLNDSGRRTPKVDSRLSVPSHFGSGVSFRVSRRSDLLQEVGSGYIGEVTVQMEPAGELTPCISRPGAARKSKARRVTICPEENTEYNVSAGTSPGDSTVNATALLDPDSTPVHFCETTHTAKPHPVQGEESVIEDRLIKPSPPEQGLRRSQRTRLKPIAWYKNEQVVFDYRRRSGPAIIGVKPSLEVKWKKLEEERRQRRMLKYQIRKASSLGKDKPYRKLSIHTELPTDIDIAENSDPEITVYDHFLQSEDGIECIGKREAFKPVGPTHETAKKEDPYLITKHLSHPCMTAGKLCIKPNAEKSEQLVTADYIVFFIEYGKVLVKIHKTTVLLETGDTFMVPIGNTYSISNLRSDTARLFYTIHKQVDDPDKSGDSLHEGLTV